MPLIPFLLLLHLLQLQEEVGGTGDHPLQFSAEDSTLTMKKKNQRRTRWSISQHLNEQEEEYEERMTTRKMKKSTSKPLIKSTPNSNNNHNNIHINKVEERASLLATMRAAILYPPSMVQ